MSDVITELVSQKEKPAYVTFHIITEEDAQAGRAAGHYVSRDVDMVHITPAYTKDVIKHKVNDWWVKLESDVAGGRIPEEWVRRYKAQYEAWKKGQALPLDGIPIKGWGVISPAQQETLIRMNILTVEDLAGVNDDGIRRIGMGGVTLKNKANAWLQQLKDKGPLTQEVAALKSENNVLKGSIESLTKQVEALSSRLSHGAVPIPPVQETPGIAAADILDELPDNRAELRALYEAKFGKAPPGAMKDETLKARLKE